jgi:hypothetical protein
MNEGKVMNKYEASKSESQHQQTYINKIRKSQLAHQSKKIHNLPYPRGVGANVENNLEKDSDMQN